MVLNNQQKQKKSKFYIYTPSAGLKTSVIYFCISRAAIAGASVSGSASVVAFSLLLLLLFIAAANFIAVAACP